MRMLGRETGTAKVELRAEREAASMAWVLSRGLAEIVARELRESGWSVSLDDAAAETH